jgi:prepilin-type N-terminal cleavage/methylation domain-containing protein
MSNIKGFTLVELSMVIIIIGLLISGIAAGTSLIEQAKLNSIIRQSNEYTVAFKTFQSKYNALPGLMSNASAYWPTGCVAVGLPATDCDGSGGTTYTSLADGVRAWKHLSLAGLISVGIPLFDPSIVTASNDGYFEVAQSAGVGGVGGVNAGGGGGGGIGGGGGVRTHGDGASVVGTSLPASSIEGAGYLMDNSGTFTSGNSTQYSIMRLGKTVGGGYYTSEGALTPMQSFVIDQKMDDASFDANGNAVGASTGNVRSASGASATTSCGTGTAVNSEMNQYYNTSNSNTVCIMGFFLNL